MGVFITGAGSGMGRETALTLARQGVPVGINDLVAERAEAVAEEIATAGGRAIAAPCDVTDESSVQAAIGRCVDEWGELRGLVNAAGIAKGGAIRDAVLADWDVVMRVNFMSALVCTKAAWEALEKSSGAVVNFASISALVPASRVGAYSASKAAVVALTQQTAVEGGPSGIRANAVAPGFITGTIMSSGADANKELSELRGQRVPLRRLGKTDDVATVVAFLLSDAARYITGQVLPVDGGIGISVMDQLPRQVRKD
ncbi:MAG: SDR family NAD(P)-dependent oxidoreductase [Solirubrobacterales bacterium]